MTDKKDSLSWVALQLARLRELSPTQLESLQNREDVIFVLHRPSFCPNCGAPTDDMAPEIDTTKDTGGYDVYCKLCEWSGDVYPDALADLTDGLLEYVEAEE